jgi:thiosulfate/3-mercaptopyruvate sulfurtransferase
VGSDPHRTPHLRIVNFVQPQTRPLPLTFVLCWLLASLCHPAFADPKPAASIPTAFLVEPADFAAALRTHQDPNPISLQVGFRTLYDQAHIPGAEYAGPANDADGLRRLRDRVARLPKDTPIILYCGCCPWAHCPNIAAAFETLHALGFSRLKVLHIAENFGTDWVDKGYPADRS